MAYTLTAFTVVIFQLAKCDNIVILQSNVATIVGRKLYTIHENTPYAAFWRVPYADPPLNELRFKPPKMYQSWLDHVTYDYSRPYNDTCAMGLNEDCLYLSVYTPVSENSSTVYPVFVWVHEQSNLHEPDFLIDEDVIVVTVSYRTSILGFLNTGDEFARGNMGAKDILMALKWIREYINVFHGDPGRVTIGGAGLASSLVASFLVSPAAEDLFLRAIIQSGSALSPADYANYTSDILNKLYWRFNGPFRKLNRKRLYEILNEATITDLRLVSEDLFDSTEVRNKQRLINTFGPTVENTPKHAFMYKNPIEVYKRKMSNNNADVMMGYTSLESLYKLKGFARHKKLLKYLNYNFQYLLPFEGVSDGYGSKQYEEIRNKIMDFYFLNGTIGERSLRRYVKYNSDQVVYPLLRQARLQAETARSNVFLYRFSFNGVLNVGWNAIRNLNYSGATAGDEICYLFRCKSVNDVYGSGAGGASNERQFIKKIARLWTNFVKCGNPTPMSDDDILGDLHWKPLARDKGFRGMHLGSKLKMMRLPEEKRVQFWDELKHEFFPGNFWRKDEL